MPIVTAAGSFNVGKDVSLSVIGPNGALLSIGISRTSWSAQQRTNTVMSRPSNGPPIFAEIPDGWSLSFALDRANAEIDNLFCQAEDYYWTSGNVYIFNVTETITNTDGSISQYRYEGCTLKYENGGSWQADQKVDQRFTSIANRRRQVI